MAANMKRLAYGGGDEAPPETTPGRDRPGGRGMNTIPNPVQVALRRERRARRTAQRNAHELQKKNTLLRQCVARLQHEIRQLEEEKNQ